MIPRDKETVSRRSILERDQATNTEPRRFREPRRSRGLSRLIPVLIVAFVLLVIAREEIPAVSAWWEKTFNSRDWAVMQACQQAALGSLPDRQFGRVVDAGKVHRTEEGFYVDKLVLGEMGPEGAEQKIDYSCYLDNGYQVVKVNRLDP